MAEYAEIVRGSYWARESSFDDVLGLAYLAGGELEKVPLIGADVIEFIGLVERARGLSERHE